MTQKNQDHTIGSYLIKKLYEKGVRHVFGIPGDYVLDFYEQLVDSKLAVINTCDEQGAGFAADAYARLCGLGAVCVTYGVGGLKLVNTTAQAFAEESPVVVISGAPGMKEREINPLLHHKVRTFDTQMKIFEQITVACAILNDPETAPREIDRVISAALRHKRPVYIELPRDKVSVHIMRHRSILGTKQSSDRDALQEAITEALHMINNAEKPCTLVGAELKRYGLQDQLLEFVERTNIPVATTILGKSVISGYHPLCMGVYAGAISRESVRDYVESSDCLIIIGAYMTDINTGIFTAQIDQSRTLQITSEKIAIRHHIYDNVQMQDFLLELIKSCKQAKESDKNRKKIPHIDAPKPFSPIPRKRITVQRLFQCINSFLSDNMIVVTDVGDALFASTDLIMHERTEFLSPAYYACMGFAVPAAIGSQLAQPHMRPLVLVGDGAFQMTGMELSVAVRFDLNPIVVVLNNRGYATERQIVDGPFNDLQHWEFSKISQVIGGGRGYVIEDEEQLHKTLIEALEYKQGFCILDVRLGSGDISLALDRLTSALAKQVRSA